MSEEEEQDTEDKKEESPLLLKMTRLSTLVTDKLPAEPKDANLNLLVNQAGGLGTSEEQELFGKQFKDLQVPPLYNGI